MVELLHLIWPEEIYRVAISLLDLETPLNSPSALCVLRLVLENAGIVALRLTDIILRLGVLLYAMLEALRLMLCVAFVAPERHLRKNQEWHPVTIEDVTARCMLSTLLLLDITRKRMKAEPRCDEVDRFLALLSRYQCLTEKMIGPGYETLVKQFKVSQLQEIRRECEALHKDVTDIAGPGAVDMLQASYSRAPTQPPGVRSLRQDIDERGIEDEVENDLWHDYPEEGLECELLREGEAKDNLQDIWADETDAGNEAEKEVQRVEDNERLGPEEDEDEEEVVEYDPEDEQTISDEEVDTYDYKNDPEGYFAGVGNDGTRRK